MVQVITSPQNQVIKATRALFRKKMRDKLGKFVIEGSKLISEALSSFAGIEFVLMREDFVSNPKYQELLLAVSNRGIKVYHITEQVFDSLAETETPQGIMAVLKLPQQQVEDVLTRGREFIILDNIQDPGNLGTIIRTADAAGFNGVILTEGSADPFNGKTIRSTMGSIFHLPVITVPREELVRWAAKLGIDLYVADLRGETNIFQLRFCQPFAIVLGNEARGPDSLFLQHARNKVIIPIPGQAESLNVAVAAGILIYERVRQRMLEGAISPDLVNT